MVLLIAILVFAAVFCATFAVYFIVQNRLSWQSRAIKKRLDGLSGETSQVSETVSILRQEEKFSTIPVVDQLLKRFSISERIKKLIAQSGSHTNPGTVILAMGSLGMLAFLLCHYATNNLLLSLVAIPGPAVLPYLYLAYKRLKRLRLFEEQLPEALDMIVSALRSGFTFELSLKMVAQELPDPLAYEFAIVFEEQHLGVPLSDALTALRERVPSDDLDLLIVTLVLHRRTGGNLAEVLEKTAGTIRERFRLKREIHTKTAHGRFSGFVLILMPVVMIGILLTMAPEYFMLLIRDKVGQYLLATAVAMQIIGIWVIKRIVNIRL